MFEKTKAQLQPVAMMPKNLQITMLLSAMALLVAVATLIVVAGKGVK